MNTAVLAGFGFTVLFGLQVVLQSATLKSSVHPLQLLFLVYLACAVILTIVYSVVNRKVFSLRLRGVGLSLFLVATLLWILGDIVTFVGLTTSSSINFSILSRLNLFFTYIGAVVFLREPATFKKGFALCLGFVGSVIVSFHGQRLFFSNGDVLFVLSALFVSGSGLIRQHIGKDVSSLQITYWMFALASVILGIIVALVAPITVIPHIGSVTAIAILAVGGFTFVNYSIIHGGASQFSLIATLLPLMTAVFAYFIHHEVPSVNQLFGGALIIVSIVLFTRNSKRR